MFGCGRYIVWECKTCWSLGGYGHDDMATSAALPFKTFWFEIRDSSDSRYGSRASNDWMSCTGGWSHKCCWVGIGCGVKICIGFCFGISTTEAQCFEYGFKNSVLARQMKLWILLKRLTSQMPVSTFKYISQIWFSVLPNQVIDFCETGVMACLLTELLKLPDKNSTTHHIALQISSPIFAISILTDKGFATISQEKFMEYLQHSQMTKRVLIGWRRNGQVP